MLPCLFTIALALTLQAQEPIRGDEPSVAPDRAPAPADESGYVGSWSTSFGPLELEREGGRFVGRYTIAGDPGHLNGEVESGRLHFLYFGPGTDGEGWFELRDDGSRLDGRWRREDGTAWLPWTGRRRSALTDLPALRPGEPIEDRIDESVPLVMSDGLVSYSLGARARARTYRLEVPESGPYLIELRSHDFDTYLVLRDVEGNVLAENDDGLGGVDARLAMPSLRTDELHVVDVCALGGGTGTFVVSLRAETAPPVAPEAAPPRPLKDAANNLRMIEEFLGSEHPDAATAAIELAWLYMLEGRLDEALALFERALAIRERAFGPDHLLTAESLGVLGGALMETGHLARARPLLERVLRILERELGPDDPAVARTLSTLVGVLGEQGLYTEAIPLAERAHRIAVERLGPDAPFTAFCAMNLGYARLVQGRSDEARQYLEHAVAALGATPGSRRETVMALFGLGWTLGEQGLWQEARSALDRCLRLCEETFGPDHVYTAIALSGLARPLREMGLHADARPLLQRAARILDEDYGPWHHQTTAARNELATVLADLGAFEPAFAEAQRAITSTETRVGRELKTLTESERLRFAAELRSTLEFYLSLAPLVAAPEDDTYRRVLAWKGRVSRSLLSTEPPSPGEEQALVTDLRRAQSRLSNAFSRADVADLATHEAVLAALREETGRLELELVRLQASRRDAAGERDRRDEEATLEAVAQRIPRNAAVVDYFVNRVYHPASWQEDQVVAKGRWSEPRLTAWVLRHGADAPRLTRFDLGEVAAVEQATARYLGELTGRPADARGVRLGDTSKDAPTGPSAPADAVRRLVWDPLASAVGDSDLVLLSPDTFLGTLPFETLQQQDGSYLIEHRAFVYLRDVASLPSAEQPADETDPRLLLAGGVDYREREPSAEPREAEAARSEVAHRGSFDAEWPPLPATFAETDAIAALHRRAVGAEGDRVVLTGRAATEERIKRELPGCRYVHLATHGYFQPERLASQWREARGEDGARPAFGMGAGGGPLAGLGPGLLSGLVFSGANAPNETGRDNGLLTAEEVRHLDLSHCELVVLSACETGLGRPESGEGMMGLRRAFRQAGARAVVSSLWSVEDEATSELMRRFYERLWTHRESKLDALRGAQLDMLAANRRDLGNARPSTWGAFVLSGDWR